MNFEEMLKNMDFEELLQELEKTTKKLENKNIQLKDALLEYKKGKIISEKCKQLLEQANKEINIEEIIDAE